VVVFDFETTGMSPAQGDRVIEVGAVRLTDGEVCARFQSLINPGVRLNPFISELTGISEAMLAKAPAAGGIMAEFRKFIGSSPLVAHNASFDHRFLASEFERYGNPVPDAVGCSMLVARRLFPEVPNHKLETLVRYFDLPSSGRFHRALADASMTAALWHHLYQTIVTRYSIPVVHFALMQKLGRTPKGKAHAFLLKAAEECCE